MPVLTDFVVDFSGDLQLFAPIFDEMLALVASRRRILYTHKA